MALRINVQSPLLYQLSHDPLPASLFYHLAKQRDVKQLKYVLSRGTDLNVRDPNGKNALIMALEAYDHAAVEILLDIGADPTHNDNKHNESALRVVCTHNKLPSTVSSVFLQKFRQKCSNSEEAAQKLIDAGGHLYQAAHTKDAKILEYMLERGFPVNFTPNELTKTTALHVAVSLTDLDSAKVLLNHSADVHSTEANGCNPLFYAYGYRGKDHSAEKVEMLQLLLSRGASLTTSNSRFGICGFFQAAKALWHGDSRAVALVLSHWDFTAKDEYGDLDVLHYLALNHNPGLTDELKVHAHKLNVNAVARDGLSPLYLAAESANARVLEFLLNRGCDVDKAIGSNARPALYGACTYPRPGYEKEYAECVDLLLEYGADPQWIKDQDETIFGSTMSNEHNVSLSRCERLKPVIARLAMMEELGTTIREVIRAKIRSHSEWQVSYDRCREVLRTRVYGTLTLLKLLTASWRNWVKYAGNEDLFNELGRICDKLRAQSSFSYYRKILTKRMSRGTELRKLRDEAAGSICRIFGGCIGKTHVVTSRISDYLNEQDLRQLCQL